MLAFAALVTIPCAVAPPNVVCPPLAPWTIAPTFMIDAVPALGPTLFTVVLPGFAPLAGAFDPPHVDVLPSVYTVNSVRPPGAPATDPARFVKFPFPAVGVNASSCG